uniref:Heparan-sulfate 6-O-sulfotransferase n=1 Tax=Hippocampus comes TaxID=109280 RepID=A0A3Q2Z012_HIPCM
MEDKFNRLIFIPIAAVLCFMIGYQYVCPAESKTCYFRREESVLFEQYSSLSPEQQLDEDLPDKTAFTLNFTERDLDRHVDFDIRGDDVMVFLHIQKTGGTTFGRHLVKNIQLEQPCECTPGQRKCTCHRPGKSESWLFSRFSTGWSCGLHADWTELTSCVPWKPSGWQLLFAINTSWRHFICLSSLKSCCLEAARLIFSTFCFPCRNFYYITMLRDPVSRFLSEWKHVQRGATWKTALHMCDGRPPTQDELPACYSGEDWTGVTLADFMDCPSNLANNRQFACSPRACVGFLRVLWFPPTFEMAGQWNTLNCP